MPLHTKRVPDCNNQSSEDIQHFNLFLQQIHLEGDQKHYEYHFNFFAESRLAMLKQLNKQERTELLLPYNGDITAYIEGEAQNSKLQEHIFKQRNLNRKMAGRAPV